MQVVEPLTKKQKQTLDFITSFRIENSYSPSLNDIAKYLKTKNLSTAQYYVEQLEEKGCLKRFPNRSRGIMLLTQAQSVPLLGYIAAGEPIEPIENPETIEVPASIKLKPNHSYYALRVKGDSMQDMNIADNDTVLVQHQMTAENGDVVVGVTEKGATLKTFKKRRGKVILEPRNQDYKAIEPKSLEIRGKFVGLIRSACYE
ncbi:MAG: transcriptional repressor LexA [bacterium]